MKAFEVYCVSGLKVRSSVAFPELRIVNEDVVECFFDLLPEQTSCPVRYDWFHHWEFPNGERWLSLAKRDDQYILRFQRLADFLVSSKGNEIACRPQPQTPLDTVRHLFLDQVVPLVLNLRGTEALHASAVLTPYGACAFIGQTGRGKSTLASSFLNCGSTPLSDDCLALEERAGHILAVPSYAGLRLWSDTASTLVDDAESLSAVAHYTEKKRINFHVQEIQEPVPLKAIYILTPPIEQIQEPPHEVKIDIEPLGFSRAFQELLQCVFRLDVTDSVMLSRQFLFLHRLLSAVPVLSLGYPRDYTSLPGVREAILHHLKKTSQEGINSNESNY
jgi:hypothetical protein